MPTTLDGDLNIAGNFRMTGGPAKKFYPDIPRSNLAQESLARYPIPLSTFFVFDSGQPLPAAAAADDLTLSPGTHGTSTPCLSAGDCKTLTVSRKARAVIALPPEYVTGQTVTLAIAAGMLTTVASSVCTVDLQVYKLGRDGLVSGGDLVITGVTSMNSLTFGELLFALEDTGLSPSDQLDVLVTIACVDVGTLTVVKPTLASIDRLCDIRG